MREDLNKILVLCSIFGFIGLLLVLFSDTIGISLADGWLAKYDYADTTIYEFKMKANTIKFFVTGGILFATNLVAILIVYYKMLISKE
jgi:hypothetical protein